MQDYEMEIVLREIKVAPEVDQVSKVTFVTSRGTGRALFHHEDGNKSATILVGGTGGGYDGPASIYPAMGTDLLEHDISSLRLDYRKRNFLEECVLDVLLGIEFLKQNGIERVGLAGWSYGGAVVIEAAANDDTVKAVVTIASQTYGTHNVKKISPRPILLIHGTGDQTLTPECSKDLYARAGEPKDLILYPGANHGVDQNRNEMLGKIEDFFIKNLNA